MDAELSAEELRALELDENVQRLDLDDYEASKQRLREIEAAAQEAEEVSREEPAKPGRPRGGNREAARRLGVDESTIRDTRRHVETAEQHPVFQRPEWKIEESG